MFISSKLAIQYRLAPSLDEKSKERTTDSCCTSLLKIAETDQDPEIVPRSRHVNDSIQRQEKRIKIQPWIHRQEKRQEERLAYGEETKRQRSWRRRKERRVMKPRRALKLAIWSGGKWAGSEKNSRRRMAWSWRPSSRSSWRSSNAVSRYFSCSRKFTTQLHSDDRSTSIARDNGSIIATTTDDDALLLPPLPSPCFGWLMIRWFDPS